MSDSPAPLVPPDCDLRDFPYLPLDARRLRDSRIVAVTTGEEFRSAVLLWCASWHQVPASSLPDDDLELGQLAGFGRVQRAWLDVRAGALHGWVKCSDGRLYHPVIAEKAIRAWNDKLTMRWKRECDRIRKENRRRSESGEELLALPAAPSEVRQDGGNSAAFKRNSCGSEDVAAGNCSRSDGKRCVSDGNPAEIALKVKRREGKERDSKESSLRSDDRALASLFTETGCVKPKKPERRHVFPEDAFNRWYAGYPHKVGRGAAEKAFRKVQTADCVAFEDLVAGLARYRQTKPIDHPFCNPATWLNEQRWADQRASNGSAALGNANSNEPRVDFGDNVVWPESTVRRQIAKWRANSSAWPDFLGPPPNKPGCRVPAHLLATAA